MELNQSATVAIVPFGMPDPLNKRAKGATPQEVQYLAKLLSTEQRISMMPNMPVTIVNLNPFDLVVLHPLFDGLTVKANKGDEAYSALVIRNVKFQVDQGLDRNHTPVEFWPIQLATEFSTRYAEKGGVFHINGDLEKNPELAHTEEFHRLFKKSDEALVRFCRQLKQTADGEWNSPNHSGARNIHPPHRMAAKMLKQRGLIKELPAWMSGDIDVVDKTDDCPVCMAHTKKGQLKCQCSYVLVPFAAFKAQAIDEYDQSLERLTRAQVKELGVSAYVAETADERPKRLEAGEAKPYSLFEVQQQKLLDAENNKKKASK